MLTQKLERFKSGPVISKMIWLQTPSPHQVSKREREEEEKKENKQGKKLMRAKKIFF